MHRSSATWADSEFDTVPVARAGSVLVRAPRPAASRVSMECRVAHVLDLGQTHLFVGEVLLFHVEDGLPPALLEELKRRGHTITPASVGDYGGYQAIWRDPATGVYTGATEKRKDGCALGY